MNSKGSEQAFQVRPEVFRLLGQGQLRYSKGAPAFSICTFIFKSFSKKDYVKMLSIGIHF